MNNNLKKILCVVLGVVLLISIIPAALFLKKAPQNNPTLNAGAMPSGTEFISMPITIRDFAADGMLFEFNQFEKPGDYYVAGTSSYSGLKAYFAEAPEVDVYDKTQFADGANKAQKQGYVRYYPGDEGLKLSFKIKGLNNGNNFTRGDVDFVVLKFRTSKNHSTDNYPTMKGYSAPFIAQRGPSGTKADPYGSSLKLYNNDRTLSCVSNNKDNVVTEWKKMLGTSPDATSGSKNGEWQYTKVHLSGGETEVTYITLYINQIQGHIDFGGLWVFNSSNGADSFMNSDRQYGTNEYYLGDNKGYGFLMTDDNDYYNCLPSSSNNIAGSNLYINGSWGDTTEPSAITATLNSGAKQKVYGAVIRTDLVEPYLDQDGKPVYTDGAVTFLQDLLKKTLPVEWEREPKYGSDNAYNLYHVMGVKLFSDELEYVGPGTAATKDLAQLLREKITGDGTLADTKAKVLAGNLTVPTDIETYFDAAYFLLHNTWRDSQADTANSNDGYGMPISKYNKLNLIQTTNKNGQKCYVFNSGYDGAIYDSATGDIYNTQVSTMTKVQDTSISTTGIVRGMILPEYRFDPLGNNLGYGISGNIYATEGLRDDQWKDTYYAETNYNLSLEGHAKFVYYEDSNQYFTFTGDDDVYLYIDGTRVLDVGAAHSIAKVSINLNDVAKQLGLVDGQVYDFDFFYMERHGTAANFSIETNIQIVDPAMTTSKNGYQNGINTGYNGYVDPSKPVTYDFILENKGDEAIKNLEFTDATISTTLTKDAITLNSNSSISKLSVTLYNPDGTIKAYDPVGSLTETKLKTYLENGLLVGEKIVIYGFDYQIPNNAWETRTVNGETSNKYFYNMVNTSATSESGATLNGLAHWVVQQKKANFADIHLYNWGYLNTGTARMTDLISGGSVELLRSELNEVITDAGQTVTGNEAIKISNATGITDSTQTNNINSKATVNGNTITYQASSTGSDIYYVMVGDNGPIRVAVYTYGVADNSFVIDYNLPVKFTPEALGNKSVVDIASENSFGTTVAANVTTKTTTYGVFAPDNLDAKNVAYTMKKIMNGVDTTEVTLIVRENGSSGEITKFNGVEMPMNLTVAPASIMYYEDNFIGEGALNYVGNWTQYGTGGNTQSADQEMNYGYDPNYSTDKIAPNLLNGDASNGTIRVHTVPANSTLYELMTFEFTGTGFEIISRTTDMDYCIIEATVVNSNDEKVSRFPVICESEAGDLYQVPVIAVTDLAHDTYTVTLSVSNNTSATNKPKVYVDGVRIYSPLTTENELKYYSADEAQATITPIKTLIKNGSVVYAAKSSDSSYILAAGDTAIENYDGTDNFVLKENVDLNEYLVNGPNNELYLDGQNSGYSVIAFYVTPTANFTGERTIQIGAHRKTDALYGDTATNKDSVTLIYGSTADALTNASYTTTVQSGTEQYYTIDVANLQKDSDGRYLVIIGMSSNNNKGLMPVLSITNLKLSGYTIQETFNLPLQSMPTNE